MKKAEEFFLVNKQRTRVKRFRKFENISHKENDFIEIEYGCVYKSSSKPIHKVVPIESIEETGKEYLKLLEEDWKKTNIF